MARSFKPEPLVIGLSLIGVGTAWLLANAGLIDLLGTLRSWWPLMLVVWGLLELVAYAMDRDPGRSVK
jgi:hypothetical protein